MLEVVLRLRETVVVVASLAATSTRAAWLKATVHAFVQAIQNCSSQLLRIFELLSDVFFLLGSCSSRQALGRIHCLNLVAFQPGQLGEVPVQAHLLHT